MRKINQPTLYAIALCIIGGSLFDAYAQVPSYRWDMVEGTPSENRYVNRHMIYQEVHGNEIYYYLRILYASKNERMANAFTKEQDYFLNCSKGMFLRGDQRFYNGSIVSANSMSDAESMFSRTNSDPALKSFGPINSSHYSVPQIFKELCVNRQNYQSSASTGMSVRGELAKHSPMSEREAAAQEVAEPLVDRMNEFNKRLSDSHSINHESIVNDYRANFIGRLVLAEGKVRDVSACGYGDAGYATKKYSRNECVMISIKPSFFGNLFVYAPKSITNDQETMSKLRKDAEVKIRCRISQIAKYNAYCEL